MKNSSTSLVKQPLSADFASSSAVPLTDPRLVLVQRVAASEHLRTSIRLRDFLLYIADCAIREAPEDAAEQQIGVHVFQRAPGYNCSDDSIVRTHARLLRQKLAAYFATEGSAEELVIEVPKGHYLPVFRLREPNPAPQLPPAEPSPVLVSREKEAAPARAPRPRAAIWIGIALVLLLTLVAIAMRASWPRHSVLAESPLDALWAPFLSGRPPLVIYSNARFIGDSKTGLRYPPANTAPDQPTPEHSVDHYTGIGEVAAVYQLTRLFDSHQASFVLKRSLLVTWDEAKLTNLIFIGSTAENPSLKILPSTTDFTMVTGSDYAGVVNHHPRPGEPLLFSRPEHPLDKDYAIIALMPAVEPGRQMLVLSGLTTLGTQAAVEFVCRKESVAELFKAASFSKGQVRPFEALIEVAIGGGVPLQTKLIAVRAH